MAVSLNFAIAKELITFKLNSLQTTLNNILSFWNQDTVEQFIDKSKSGLLENAEIDAITVRQLIVEIDNLQSLLNSFQVQNLSN